MDTYERIIAAASPAGLYESNYLKANAPDGTGAFWIKHNVLTPAPGAEAPAVAEFWFVVWLAADGWVPRVHKHVEPLSEVTLSSSEVAITGPTIRLRPDRAVGRMDGAAVTWDLEITDELPALHHFADQWMYEASFPRKKVVTPSPRARFDGKIELDGARLDVEGWIGHRNHNWGTEHAFQYAYGGCNLWNDGADLTVEGFTVQVRLVGPLRSPWMTMLTGLENRLGYGTGTVLGSLRSAGRVHWPVWRAVAPTADGRRARLRMELDPAHTAGLRYLHPDGTVSYCYNAKDARVDLRLGSERHTSNAGELEFLFPEPVEGVPLHGDRSLDELRSRLA